MINNFSPGGSVYCVELTIKEDANSLCALVWIHTQSFGAEHKVVLTSSKHRGEFVGGMLTLHTIPPYLGNIAYRWCMLFIKITKFKKKKNHRRAPNPLWERWPKQSHEVRKFWRRLFSYLVMRSELEEEPSPQTPLLSPNIQDKRETTKKVTTIDREKRFTLWILCWSGRVARIFVALPNHWMFIW